MKAKRMYKGKQLFNKMFFSIISFLTPRMPVLATRLLFAYMKHYFLNLSNPGTYNEKLQWLKLYDENPVMIRCGDKYTVRGYVEEKGCPELLNELYGVYDSVDDIDFSAFPQKFVLKVTNACGYNIICDKQSFDEDRVRAQLKHWQHKQYGLATAEPHYSRMKSRIVCERFLEDSATGGLNDYRVHCLNGIPVYVAATRKGQHGQAYRFDFEKNLISLPGETIEEADVLKIIPDDALLMQLHDYAKRLSAGIRLVRIDFYIVDNKIYLGEMTFTPGAGFLQSVDLVFQLPKYSSYLDGLC
jgi:hypothetical protein